MTTISPRPAGPPSPPPGAPPKRVSRLMLLALTCAVLQIVWYYNCVPGQPPSLVVLFLGFGAIILGMAALVTINKPGSTVKGRPLAGIAMVLGLLSTLFLRNQLVAWRAGQERREMDNVAAIAAAAHQYAQASGGQYPPDLAALWADAAFTRGMLISPFSMKPLAAVNADLAGIGNAGDRRRAVDDASDYVYTGRDLSLPALEKHPDARHALIVAYGKDQNHNNDRAVAFADDHAEYVPGGRLVAASANNNAARRMLGLPPIDLDEPSEEPATAPAPPATAPR